MEDDLLKSLLEEAKEDTDSSKSQDESSDPEDIYISDSESMVIETPNKLVDDEVILKEFPGVPVAAVRAIQNSLDIIDANLINIKKELERYPGISLYSDVFSRYRRIIQDNFSSYQMVSFGKTAAPSVPSNLIEVSHGAPAPSETIGTHSATPPDPSETIGTHSATPPDPSETIGMHSATPPDPSETIGIHSATPPDPSETIGTHSATPPDPSETIGIRSATPPDPSEYQRDYPDTQFYLDKLSTVENYMDYFALDSFPWSSHVRKVLKEVFGHDDFRGMQKEIINCAMLGLNNVVLMPTGAGKSLTFQIPAIISTGLTVVISPLISLIQDQTAFLTKKGVRVAFFTDDKNQNGAIIRSMYGSMDSVKLLYVTPERLARSSALLKAIDLFFKAGKLTRLVVDEAHCISSWGHDFRPDYARISQFVKRYPGLPTSLLTATATARVLQDMIEVLEIKGSIYKFITSFNRPNLYYEVRKKRKDTAEEIARLINEEFPRERGIVYCFSRADTVSVCRHLESRGIRAMFYHADIDQERRRRILESWKKREIHVVVATIAFGMGIDVPDVRFVIHHTLPKSIEGYYQESGRAGRDGKPSRCILYYSDSDARKLKSFLTRGRQDKNIRLITHVQKYCNDTVQCRRVLLLEYFGESFGKESCDGMCDNCRRRIDEGTEIEKVDMAEEALALIDTISEMQKAGITTTKRSIVNVCIKSKARSVRNQIRSLLSYGRLKEKFGLATKDIESLLLRLQAEGFLHQTRLDINKPYMSALFPLSVSPGARDRLVKHGFTVPLARRKTELQSSIVPRRKKKRRQGDLG